MFQINFKKENINKKIAIINLLVCSSLMLIGRLIESYRGTWIYQDGKPFVLFAIIGGIFLSFLNTFFYIINHYRNLKKHILWIFLSSIPFLYISIMLILAVIYDNLY
jgi:hypothetical protein